MLQRKQTSELERRSGRTAMTDTNLLLIITIAVFVVMYAGAVIFLGAGFLKPQTFFNILNENAALIILSCGMSLVMITGGIDISVGTVTALVCMVCAVHLDYQGGNVFTALLLALGIGLAFGLVQGFLVLRVLFRFLQHLAQLRIFLLKLLLFGLAV